MWKRIIIYIIILWVLIAAYFIFYGWSIKNRQATKSINPGIQMNETEKNFSEPPKNFSGFRGPTGPPSIKGPTGPPPQR